MSKTSVIIAFTLGAAAGAVTTGFVLKRYYDKLVNEEIQSVKDMYKKKLNLLTDTEIGDNKGDTEESEKPEDKRAANIRKYKERMAEFGYSDESEDENKEEDSVDAPYVISPEEFGEDQDYEIETLTYYNGDKVLTDDFDNQVEDVEGMVGEASLNTFGQYEDDAVYVKNDKTKHYYEILKDNRSFFEAMRTRRGR